MKRILSISFPLVLVVAAAGLRPESARNQHVLVSDKATDFSKFKILTNGERATRRLDPTCAQGDHRRGSTSRAGRPGLTIGALPDVAGQIPTPFRGGDIDLRTLMTRTSAQGAERARPRSSRGALLTIDLRDFGQPQGDLGEWRLSGRSAATTGAESDASSLHAEPMFESYPA